MMRAQLLVRFEREQRTRGTSQRRDSINTNPCSRTEDANNPFSVIRICSFIYASLDLSDPVPVDALQSPTNPTCRH